jgi:hypothetical protein
MHYSFVLILTVRIMNMYHYSSRRVLLALQYITLPILPNAAYACTRPEMAGFVSRAEHHVETAWCSQVVFDARERGR